MKKNAHAKIVSLTPEVLRNRTLASKVVMDASDTLSVGGLVIMPTETAYGIAADATNDDAVRRVFEAKQRPLERSLPIMVSDRYMIEEYAELSALARHLMHSFMPGPLSLVVPLKVNSGLASSVSGSSNGISFRIPGNDFARAIVAELGKPVTTTSANISGEGTLYAADEVRAAFLEKVDLILDQGNLAPVQPSTIVDLLGDTPKIIRQGPISETEVHKAIQEFRAKVVVATA
ncbi:threonylcarbamoyl-AMP synthase [Candidatus Micrarchaeota archaeon]|nr:threonylcarbamoyl-AMP synthase [Candidatus Micrarchaeota archaeon]